MPIIADIIAWLTTHAGRLAIIGALSMLLGVAIYSSGASNSAAKCASNSAENLANDIGNKDKNHEKVMRMPRDAVDSGLDKFLRSPD